MFDKYCLIKVEGKFWAKTLRNIEPVIKSALMEGRLHIAFDLSQTELLDSSAIGMIVNLHRNLGPKGGGVSLVSVPPKVHAALATANVTKLLKLFSSFEDAKFGIEGPVIEEERGFYLMLRIKGEFRLTAIKPIRQAIENAMEIGHRNIAFELSETKFIDSVGIGTIMNVYKQLKAKGGAVYLINVSPEVMPALETSHITQLITQFKSPEEADREII